MHLDGMAIFVKVVQAGSLSRAARLNERWRVRFCNQLHDVSRYSRLIKTRRLPYIGGMENIDDRLTQALDEALEMTFPASDPIALSPPRPADRKEIDHEA